MTISASCSSALFDKAEAFRLSGYFIEDEVAGFDIAMDLEQLGKRVLGEVAGQVQNDEFHSGSGCGCEDAFQAKV
jgi:hypothetical protein